MGRKTKLFHRVSYFLIIISFIHAHALWMLIRGFGSIYHQILDGFTHHFHVVPIRSFDG